MKYKWLERLLKQVLPQIPRQHPTTEQLCNVMYDEADTETEEWVRFHMKTCEQCAAHPTAEDLASVFDGEADGETEVKVDFHLKSCPSCMEDMRALERADEAMLEPEE